MAVTAARMHSVQYTWPHSVTEGLCKTSKHTGHFFSVVTVGGVGAGASGTKMGSNDF